MSGHYSAGSVRQGSCLKRIKISEDLFLSQDIEEVEDLKEVVGEQELNWQVLMNGVQ